MSSAVPVIHVSPRDPQLLPLLDALSAELAEGGYTAEQTFGYSVEQLEQSGVHLVAAVADGGYVGIGGLELQGAGIGELKRFYVRPEHRGGGVADAVIASLLAYARDCSVGVIRLETGDRQHAARRFYARHGFAEVPRFAPYTGSVTSICMQRLV